MPEEIHVGDVGTSFRATIKNEDGTVLDISSASIMQLWFAKPNGIVLTKTATFFTDGTDGVLEYVTQSGDLSLDGSWKCQGYVKIGTAENHSDIHKFKVKANLQ